MVAAPDPDSVFETRDHQILRSDAMGVAKLYIIGLIT